MVIAPERSRRSAPRRTWAPAPIAHHLGFVCASAGLTPSDEEVVFGLCEAEMVDPVLVEPDRRVLAADERPSDWAAIADAVLRAAAEGVAGVVVLHGIETVANAAAGLSYLLAGRLEVPVVLTAYNTPPPAIESDASTNVRGAMVAASHLDPGVYVAFAGLAGHRCNVFLGTRARYRHASGKSLVAVGRQPVARVADGSIMAEVPPRGPADPWTAPLVAADDRVLALHLYPGCPLDALAAVIPGVRGVVLELYPNGACASSPPAVSVGRFVAACTDLGVPVIGVTPYGWRIDDQPASGPAFTSAGGVVVPLPMETAIAKLAVVLAQEGVDDPAALVARPWEHH